MGKRVGSVCYDHLSQELCSFFGVLRYLLPVVASTRPHSSLVPNQIRCFLSSLSSHNLPLGAILAAVIALLLLSCNLSTPSLHSPLHLLLLSQLLHLLIRRHPLLPFPYCSEACPTELSPGNGLQPRSGEPPQCRLDRIGKVSLPPRFIGTPTHC